jgi:hypothetical protein
MQLRWTAVTLTLVIGCGAVHEPGSPALDSNGHDAGAPIDAGAPAEWAIITAAGRLDTGNLSVMLDTSGTPHVAYSVSLNAESYLWHAWVSDGEVQAEQVDAYGRGRSKAWVPGSPEPRLVYDSSNFSMGAFHAARTSTAEWTVEILQFGEESGGASAVWKDGRNYLARVTASLDSPDGDRLVRHGVMYEDVPMPAASTRVAGERVRPQLAMAMDSSGGVHIVYTAPADDYTLYFPSDSGPVPHTVRYVTVINDQWSAPLLLREFPGNFEGLSIAIDASDTVHVAFSELVSYNAVGDGAPSLEVHHLSQIRGADWLDEVVPTAGGARLSRGSMALDDDGVLHLAYCATGDAPPRCAGVGYARQHSDAWRFETIQQGCDRLGEEASLAVGAKGNVFVAYRGCDGELSLAGRSWHDSPSLP